MDLGARHEVERPRRDRIDHLRQAAFQPDWIEEIAVPRGDRRRDPGRMRQELAHGHRLEAAVLRRQACELRQVGRNLLIQAHSATLHQDHRGRGGDWFRQRCNPANGVGLKRLRGIGRADSEGAVFQHRPMAHDQQSGSGERPIRHRLRHDLEGWREILGGS